MPSVALADMKSEMYGDSLGAGRSLDRNTSLRTLDIQTETLRKTLTMRKFAWIPTLAASYNLNWNAMSSGNALKNQIFNPYSNVALVLQVPIFNGLGRR